MYSCLVALPFIGALVSAVRGRSVGFLGAGILTTGSIGVSAALSWVALYEVVLCRSPVLITVLEWVPLAADGFSISWSFQFDDLSVIMTTVVLTISLLVHIYSMDYIAGDPHGQRFMCLLSLFTAFMVLLVTGDSLAIMFTGWEGIGVSSFLLIGFWMTRTQAVKSAIKAITINRVGDMFLTLGLFTAFAVFGSLDYAVLFSCGQWISGDFGENVLTIATVLILIGAMAKSAQIPLHTWLAASTLSSASTGEDKRLLNFTLLTERSV